MTSRAAPRRPRSIDFVLSGGATTGLGHVMRCATLADEARRRGWRVRAYLDGDDVGKRVWRDRIGRDPDGDWRSWKPGDDDPIVALDFPEPKDDWLERIAGAALRSLVIDDERTGGHAPDWLLLPGLHHAIRVGDLAPSGKTIRFVGGRYAILADLHRAIPALDADRRSRLLVSVGGADPHSITPILARALHDALDRTPTPVDGVDVVLGPAFRDPQDEIHDSIAALGFACHRGLAPKAMGALMARARLGLVGFGTTLTELAWHRTPFLCVPHSRSDFAPARSLQDVGIGRVIGDGQRIDAQHAANALTDALEDETWLRSSAARARAALEGACGERLLFEHLEGSPRETALGAAAAQPGDGAYRLGETAGAGSFD